MKCNLALIFDYLEDPNYVLPRAINVEADCWEDAWQELTGIDIDNIDSVKDKYYQINELILLIIDEDRCIKRKAHMIYNVMFEDDHTRPVMIPIEET